MSLGESASKLAPETKGLESIEYFRRDKETNRKYRSYIAKNLEWLGRNLTALDGENDTKCLKHLFSKVILEKNGAKTTASLKDRLITIGKAIVSIPGVILRLLACLDKDKFSLQCSSKITKSFKTVEEAGKLDMMTLNTGLLPTWISKNFNDLRDTPTRAHEIADRILKDYKNYQVIALQEVFNEEAKQILISRLKDRFPNLVHHAGGSYVGFDSGLLFLSRLPVIDVDYKKYANLVWEDKMTNKGFTAVKLKTGEGCHISVYNTHAQAGGWPDCFNMLWGTSSERRVGNFKLMQKHMETWAKPKAQEGSSEGTFLLGDVNVELWPMSQPCYDEKAKFHAKFFDQFAPNNRKLGPDIWDATVWDKKFLKENKTVYVPESQLTAKGAATQKKIIDAMEVSLENNLKSSETEVSGKFTNSTDHMALEGHFILKR